MLDFFVASDVYPATEGNFLKWIIRFLDQYTFPFYELFLICICGLSTAHKYLVLYARLGNKQNWIFLRISVQKAEASSNGIIQVSRPLKVFRGMGNDW